MAGAPIDLVPDSIQQFVDYDGREEMDVGGDEFAPTDEEIAEEEAAEPEMMQHAQIWDNYITWCARYRRCGRMTQISAAISALSSISITACSARVICCVSSRL